MERATSEKIWREGTAYFFVLDFYSFVTPRCKQHHHLII
jgi:hypothetical protein